MLVDFLKCKISWRAHRPWFPNLKFVDSTNHSTLFLLPSVHLRWAQVQRNWQRFGMLLISWVFTKNWFWEVFLSLCSNVLYVIMLGVNVVPPERLKVIDLWWGMVAEIYKLEQSSRHGWMWWIWQAEVHLGDDLTDSGCLSRFFIPVRLMRCSVPGVAWWERTGRPGQVFTSQVFWNWICRYGNIDITNMLAALICDTQLFHTFAEDLCYYGYGCILCLWCPSKYIDQS